MKLILKGASVAARIWWMMARRCLAGVKPTPTAPIPPPAQTPRARSAVLPAKARPAPAKGWRQPKRSVIRVEMLPILSDLPQIARVTDRFDGNRAGGPKPRRFARQPVSAGNGSWRRDRAVRAL